MQTSVLTEVSLSWTSVWDRKVLDTWRKEIRSEHTSVEDQLLAPHPDEKDRCSLPKTNKKQEDPEVEADEAPMQSSR